MARRPGASVVAWRWFSGHALDGQHRTNATWTRRADKVLHPSGRAHPWHHLPRLHRAGIRTGSTLAVLATAYGLIAATVLTAVVLAVVAASAAGYGGWRTWRAVCRWTDDRHYVRPMKRTLTRKLGLPPASVQVERDGEAVKSAVIRWGPEVEIGEAEKPLVLEAVITRLGIEAPDKDWSLKGRNRCAVFTHSEPPPSDVAWDDVAAAVRGAASNELVFGLGKRSAVVTAKYSESPHLAIPGGSGGGKSNLAAFLLLQEMMRGTLIFNLDPKWISHLWLEGLPNVISAHDIPDLHLALTWLGKELLRRTKAVYYSAEGTGRVRGTPGRRYIVLAEELNYGMPGLKNFWQETRTKEDPKRSPAIAGLEALSCAGRASDMHEYLIAQMLTVASTGVSDSTIRGNAGIKAMARWDPPGWAMAVGKHIPMPPQNTTPGRIQLVTGDGVRETQVPYLHLDDKDTDVADAAVAWARELAVSGVVAEIPGGPEGVPPQLLPASVLGHERPSLTAGQEPGTVGHGTFPPRKTLPEAWRDGMFGDREYEAVRKAAQRAGLEAKGRRGSAHVYDVEDLRALTREGQR